MIRVTQCGRTNVPKVAYQAARPAIEGGSIPGNIYVQVGDEESRIYFELPHALVVAREIVRIADEDAVKARANSKMVVGTVRLHTGQMTGQRFARCTECDWTGQGENHDAVNLAGAEHECEEVR